MLLSHSCSEKLLRLQYVSSVNFKKILLSPLQILMNALQKFIIVVRMPPVLIQLALLLVNVMQVTLEMVHIVKVRQMP